MKLCRILFLALGLLGRLIPCAAQTRQELLRSVRAPGVVPVGDSLFLDEAEVTNLHWLEYLHFIRKDSAVAFYQSQLPDTTQLFNRLLAHRDTADSYARYYLRYPGFRYFPVVGVSYEQALKYCRWRSDKVREGYLQSVSFKKKHRELLQQYEVIITYRLPTVAEWEKAATGGLDVKNAPLGMTRPPTPGTPRYKQQLLKQPADYYACLHKSNVALPPKSRLFAMEFNVEEKGYVGSTMEPFRCLTTAETGLGSPAAIPAYIYSHPPNGFGLYNMIGNVAELTATPGVAKGGSFEHSIVDFTLKTDFPYDGPQEWLGFRCACTVELRRKPATP